MTSEWNLKAEKFHHSRSRANRNRDALLLIEVKLLEFPAARDRSVRDRIYTLQSVLSGTYINILSG